MKTTAQKISAQFDDDGSRFGATNDDGETEFELACEAAGGRRTDAHDSNGRRWQFADDSVITICGPAWDLGYADCYCWQGVGHSEKCSAR